MNIKLEVTKYNLTVEEESKIKYLLEEENKPFTPENIKTLLLEILEHHLIKYSNTFEDIPNKNISNVFTFLLDLEYNATVGSKIYTEEKATV